MKIGIYGGSFNPVHFGHVGLAKWVVENTDLDELWLLVSPNNPLKPAGILAPEEERLVAVREAVKGIQGLVVSDFEFSLPRPSFTANTLRALQTAYPTYEFTLVIGEDNLAIFNQWHEYEYILANFRIFVYPRISSRQAERVASADVDILKTSDCRLRIPYSKDVIFLASAPYFDISSTELRAAQTTSRSL